MTRKECLDMAAQCVLHDRQDQYGGMEDCFISIAELWGAYLRCAIHPYDVACMMALLKVARIQSNPRHADSWTDLAGYAACGAELTDRFYGKVEPSPKAEGGCCQKGNDQPETKAKPEFKPGDRVQVRIPTAEGDRWDDAVCVSILPEGTGIRVDYRNYKAIAFGWFNIRHAPKAEGCEALVEQDAPQTPEAVCRHVVESGPAVFGQPRTPTGEELAELAEDAHG